MFVVKQVVLLLAGLFCHLTFALGASSDSNFGLKDLSEADQKTAKSHLATQLEVAVKDEEFDVFASWLGTRFPTLRIVWKSKKGIVPNVNFALKPGSLEEILKSLHTTHNATIYFASEDKLGLTLYLRFP